MKGGDQTNLLKKVSSSSVYSGWGFCHLTLSNEKLVHLHGSAASGKLKNKGKQKHYYKTEPQGETGLTFQRHTMNKWHGTVFYPLELLNVCWITGTIGWLGLEKGTQAENNQWEGQQTTTKVRLSHTCTCINMLSSSYHDLILMMCCASFSRSLHTGSTSHACAILQVTYQYAFACQRWAGNDSREPKTEWISPL